MEPPKDRFCVLGLDFAYGLEDGDYDAGVMLTGDGEQVLTVHGHWGTEFYGVLRPILDWYKPFVVGERQVGLPVLRKMYDEGYGWLYFDRNMASRGRVRRDCLGHHAAKGDLIIPGLRAAIGPRDDRGELRDSQLRIYDRHLHAELCKFQFLPKNSSISAEEARDAQLGWGAPPGEHDDLAMACAYAWAGVNWLPQFEPPKFQYEQGTLGAVLNHLEEDEEKPDEMEKLEARYAQTEH